MMRMVAGVLAAFALCAQSPPSENLDGKISQFDEALARTDIKSAASVVDGLIASRTPADGQPKVDPLISALIGRLSLAAQQEGIAALYFAKAPTATLPESVRAEVAVAYGDALDLLGERQEALDAYGRALAVSQGRHALRARLGIARQAIVTDPTSARRDLAPLLSAPDASDRWEAEYLSALAASLLGDRESASQLASRAWTDASAAPAKDLAPLKVAVLRAGLATVSGDHHTQRAMLAAANAGAASRGADLGRQLPVCGDDGVRPSDFVIFGTIIGPYNTKSLIPIAASRPGVVKPFHDRLAGREFVKSEAASNAAGTVVTLSCVTRVESGYIADREPVEPISEWFAGKGIYPASVRADYDDEGINRISDRIDDLKRRFGPSTPLLTGPNWQLLQALEARASKGDPVPPGRLVELRTALAGQLDSAGAPPWFGRLLALRSEMDRLARSAASGRPDLAAFQALWRNVFREIPFTPARYMLRDIRSKLEDPMTPEQARLITDIRDRAPASLAGRDRQAFLLIIAYSQWSAGLDPDARTTAAQTGLAPDNCIRGDTPPKLLEQSFTSKDYPSDLIPGELQGYALVEVNLTPSGTPASPRIVLSMPSGLFDQATQKGVATMRFSAPTVNGKPRACRAETKGIVWRLEDAREPEMPTLLPDTTKEST